ncbi:hypothetical protein KEM56_006987 [Ascosphaera pollenicola]|nr:hypothetical protein KEM56_006987 [Ascosphaera pollenicola]
MPYCNSTLEEAHIREEPILSNGWTFHKLALVVSGSTAIFAVVVSFIIMFDHAIHYSVPTQQRHIMRIVFMVPIYAVVSFLSLYFYRKSVYFTVLRDCYEAFAIASFFSLLCNYIADNLHDQKAYFREAVPKPWLWPVSTLKKWIFQYCFTRVAMTVVTVVTEALRKYCTDSNNPAFAHIWVTIVQAIAVTIAMFCLIQFYVQLKEDLAQYRPLLKLIAIKLVIFLSFWQTIILSFLTAGGKIHVTPKLATQDIKVGITALLLTIEMALFSLLHIFAFSAREYRLKKVGAKAQRYSGGPLGLYAWIDAFNPWDFIKAIARSAKWLVVGLRNRHDDPSYHRQVDQIRSDSAFSARDGAYNTAVADADDPVAPLAVSGTPPAGHPGAPNGELGPYGLDHWDSAVESHQMTETGRPTPHEHMGYRPEPYGYYYGSATQYRG